MEPVGKRNPRVSEMHSTIEDPVGTCSGNAVESRGDHAVVSKSRTLKDVGIRAGNTVNVRRCAPKSYVEAGYHDRR